MHEDFDTQMYRRHPIRVNIKVNGNGNVLQTGRLMTKVDDILS